MDNKIPTTWLLDEVRALGRSDLVKEFHARQQAYQKKLDKQKKDERDRITQKIKQVNTFEAYERDINAGRATERILVSPEGIIVDQTWEAFDQASEIDLPNLIGQAAEEIIEQKGFERITDWRQSEKMYDAYQNRQQ